MLLRRLGVIREKMDVSEQMKCDLEVSITTAKEEMAVCGSTILSERERSARVLYHFQKDLMTGLDEALVKSQDRREYLQMPPYSQYCQRAVWLIVMAVNAGMLYYVFLFGLSKDNAHQRAWAKSFAAWIGMEIVFFSSLLVVVSNVDRKSNV